MSEEAANRDHQGVEKKLSGNNETTARMQSDVTPTESGGFSEKWTRMIYKVRVPIVKALQAITSIAAHNPKRTITGIIVFSLGIFVIGLATNFYVDTSDQLWTPKNSKPVDHLKWIDDKSGYPEEYRFIFMTFHADGGNVLGYDQVDRVFKTVDSIRSLPGYDEICVKSRYVDEQTMEHTCEIWGMLEFWNNSAESFHANVTSDEDTIFALSALTFPNGKPVSEDSIYGFPQRDESGLLTSSLMFTVVIEMPDIEEAEDFEKDALDLILDGIREDWANEKGNDLRIEIQATRSFEDEFTRAISDDIPLLPIVFVVMSIFTCIVFAKRDKVQSRSLLGFGGVMSVLLSIFTGYGLMFVCGVPFTSMTPLIPFIIFGIGLDDTFIISGCYERTDKSKPATERIHDTIEDCGLSIFLTSLTSTLAFGLGCISTIPAIFWLCLYAFPMVAIDFLYQLTFFIACIVLDERRIQEKRRDCCVCVSVVQDAQEESSANNDEDSKAGIDQEEPKEDFSERIMGLYAEFLLRPLVKVVVLIAFTALAVACAFSTSKLTQKFDVVDVLPSDSYVSDFFNTLQENSVRSGAAPGVYFRFVDQSDEQIQMQMDEYIRDLVEIDAINEPPTSFWLDDFRSFVQNNTDGSVADLSFNEQLDLFLSDPVFDALYANHIVRDESGSITTSRCFINMDNFVWANVKAQIDNIEDQRAVTKAQGINQGRDKWAFFTYDGIYDIWEFYSVSAAELTFTTIMGVVAVTAVAFFLMPHWTAAFFIFPLISLLYVDLLGVMQWAGVDINPVSYIAIILSIGLMVDFLMHLLLRYYESTGNRREKTVETLRTMGVSILIGAVSTFLGTLPLAFASSAIFSTIFWAFLGLVTLGSGHGLILLPVILSIIGPEDQPLVLKQR